MGGWKLHDRIEQRPLSLGRSELEEHDTAHFDTYAELRLGSVEEASVGDCGLGDLVLERDSLVVRLAFVGPAEIMAQRFWEREKRTMIRGARCGLIDVREGCAGQNPGIVRG